MRSQSPWNILVLSQPRRHKMRGVECWRERLDPQPSPRLQPSIKTCSLTALAMESFDRHSHTHPHSSAATVERHGEVRTQAQCAVLHTAVVLRGEQPQHLVTLLGPWAELLQEGFRCRHPERPTVTNRRQRACASTHHCTTSPNAIHPSTLTFTITLNEQYNYSMAITVQSARACVPRDASQR